MRTPTSLVGRLPLAFYNAGPLLEADLANQAQRDKDLERASGILQRRRLPGESAVAFLGAAVRELSRVSPPVELTNATAVFARFGVFPPGTIRWRLPIAATLDVLLRRASQ